MICGEKNLGFTLIETLIALFIMSIGIVFVSAVVGTAPAARDSAYEAIAFRIASSRAAELRSLGYAALPASGPFSDPGLSTLPEGSASTTVTAWNAKTKKVTAGVSWRGTSGQTRYVSLTTLITHVGGL